MSRSTIHAPGGEVPIIGSAAKQPQQPATVMANDKGEPVIFPCVSAHVLTDHCKQELVTLIAACVDAALDRRGLGTDPDAKFLFECDDCGAKLDRTSGPHTDCPGKAAV